MAIILPTAHHRGYIGLFEVFPAADVTVTAEFPELTGGTLRLRGDEKALAQLRPRLAASFPKQGDGRYWWSAVYLLSAGELLLHFEEEEDNHELPLLEMVTRLFCQDAIRLANLRLMPWAKLTVISKEGDRLISQRIELPTTPVNGEVVIGAVA